MKVFIAVASDYDSQTNLGVFASYDSASECVRIAAEEEFKDLYVEMNRNYPEYHSFKLLIKEDFSGYCSENAVWLIADGENPSRQFEIEEWEVR